MKRWRAGSGAAAAFGVVAMIAGLAGCGGSQYTFVRDSGGSTYFKVPVTWHKVDQDAVDAALLGDPSSATAQVLKQKIWTVAYDGHTQPSIDHIMTAGPGGLDEPFAFAMVHTLSEEQQQDVSLNALRNVMGFPVTATAAEHAKNEENKEYPYKDFELTRDDVLEGDNGAKGVRVQFSLRYMGGPLQTFQQTGYLSADGSTMSTFLIRCSATCFQQRQAELDSIAQSFKVKNNFG
ncbi:hypothetical protein [Herbidospora daliensis]|uniref:hypothetical protein n=1 Tax=Herbidospora daliensis TaxID=295585 RepID=UPI000785F40B|nr:hypothetical protein [Herbidospora daliensis]